MGILVAVEGIDGAGKTTQVGLLVKSLRAAGLEVVSSKEPTDGPWGRRIRESAQNGRLPLDEELAAFIEDRKEHVANVISPALAADSIVILDRYFYSTIAYQGARGAEPGTIAEQMRQIAPVPDVVFFLDVEPAVAVNRISNGRGEVPNHFEKREYLARVRTIFQQLADAYDCIRKINGHRPITGIHKEIVEILIESVLARYRAKQYTCDCWPGLCTFGATDSCRWLTIQRVLRASVGNAESIFV